MWFLAMLLLLVRGWHSVGDFVHVGGDYPIRSLFVVMILFDGESYS
ncbi:hypothetical protein M758_4G242400 [Ceratodon purpureus]|nr:hypothetical protein M758_4G242400 [Ceratodon purpureus]